MGRLFEDIITRAAKVTGQPVQEVAKKVIPSYTPPAAAPVVTKYLQPVRTVAQVTETVKPIHEQIVERASIITKIPEPEIQEKIETRPADVIHTGMQENLMDAVLYGSLGYSGVVLAQLQTLFGDKDPTYASHAATQAGLFTGFPTILGAIAAGDIARQKGITGAPYSGIPDVSPAQPVQDVPAIPPLFKWPEWPDLGLPGLPDFGDWKMTAIIIGGALAGIYLLGKALGRKGGGGVSIIK